MEKENQIELIWPTVYLCNYLQQTTNLSSSARNLLDVFVTFMRPEDNLVYFTDHGMDFYLQYCEINLQLKYSEKTVRNALTELTKANLLLRARANIYYVNPLYSFKWSDKFDHRRIINEVQERTGVILLNVNQMELQITGKKACNSSEGAGLWD